VRAPGPSVGFDEGDGRWSVVITGCGVNPPWVWVVPAFWDALLAGRSAARPSERFPAADLTPNVAAEVPWTTSIDRAGALRPAGGRRALRTRASNRSVSATGRLGVALGTTLAG